MPCCGALRRRKPIAFRACAPAFGVDVWDGEADAPPLPSRDKQALLDALDATGEDILVVYDHTGAALGDIWLIYDDWGSDDAGAEVIADYSTALAPLLAGAAANSYCRVASLFVVPIACFLSLAAYSTFFP